MWGVIGLRVASGVTGYARLPALAWGPDTAPSDPHHPVEDSHDVLLIGPLTS